jgi:hypothetical protein
MINLTEYRLDFQCDSQVTQLDLVSGWFYRGLHISEMPASSQLSLQKSLFRLELPVAGVVVGSLIIGREESTNNPLIFTSTRLSGSHLTLREPLNSTTTVGTAINNAFTAPAGQISLLVAPGQSGKADTMPGPDELAPTADPRFFEHEIEVVFEGATNFEWRVTDAFLHYDFNPANFVSSLSAFELLPHHLNLTGNLSTTLRVKVICTQATLDIQALLGAGRVRLRTSLDEVCIEGGPAQPRSLTLRPI